MGGLSESAQQLIREIHHSAGSHCTWRDAAAIGVYPVESVAIAVQRCTGMALQASVERDGAGNGCERSVSAGIDPSRAVTVSYKSSRSKYRKQS